MKNNSVKYKTLNEYLKLLNLKTDLPNIKIYLFKGVYPPKLDSFLFAKSLEISIVKGKKILDMGTGSGILGIIALKNGASHVVAIDIDKLSIKCAEFNASLNKVNMDIRQGNLFDSIKKNELFDLIMANLPTLPTPPKEKLNKYTQKRINASFNGRKYLDPLIIQSSNYLKNKGILMIIHSNFSNIKKTEDKLKKLGFEVNKTIYYFPIGKTSGQRINYFLQNMKENCWPIRRGKKWYQRIAVFKAQK